MLSPAENRSSDAAATGVVATLTPAVEVVIPVYNEQRVLQRSIRALRRHMAERYSFPFRITIADNASNDATLELAQALADELDEVEVLRLELKGRGRALRAAWRQSDADVVAYMDVDLSTELSAMDQLLLPLQSGLTIHEVPVHWVDDPDSRVDILATAREDLRGIARLRQSARQPRALVQPDAAIE